MSAVLKRLPATEKESNQPEVTHPIHRLLDLIETKGGHTLQASARSVRELVREGELAEEMRRCIKREKFNPIQELGRQKIIESAAAMKADWESHIVSYVGQAMADEDRLVSRQEILREVKSYSFTRRYIGKNGQQIQQSTIKRWLTRESEQAIRTAAIAQAKTLVRDLR